MSLTPAQAEQRNTDYTNHHTVEQAQAIYDALAPSYDFTYHHHKSDVRRFVSLVGPCEGETLLDLGCGPAWVAIEARKYNPDGRMVCVDCSIQMLQKQEMQSRKPAYPGSSSFMQTLWIYPQSLASSPRMASRVLILSPVCGRLE